MNMRPLRASLMISSGLASAVPPSLEQIGFQLAQRIGGRVPIALAQLAKAVGVQAGGARQAGPGHASIGNEAADGIEKRGRHDGNSFPCGMASISHCNVIISSEESQ
jgi:hypothetical protein